MQRLYGELDRTALTRLPGRLVVGAAGQFQW